MTRPTARRTLLAGLLALGVVAAAPAVHAAPPPDVEKTLKLLISSIRYSKDDAALQLMDGEKQGAFLMGDLWAPSTPEQKASFISTFHGLFAGLGFRQLRENFQYLDAVTYEKPVIAGEKATCKSTLAINHPVQKKEYKVEYTLAKFKNGWRVVDVTIQGAGARSTLTDIKDNSAFTTGSFDKTLELMKKRLAALPKVEAKPTK